MFLWHRQYIPWLTVAYALGAMLCSVAPAGSQELLLTPGLGHDRFTETFFLEDSTAIDPDSLDQIKRTEDGLRESYASLGIGLKQTGWRLESTTYATDAAWRNISEGWGRVERGRFRGDLNGRLEWKGIDTDDTLASAYTYARIEMKPRLRVDEKWSMIGSMDWELGDYHGNTAYTVDYRRLRGQAGVEFIGDMLEYFDLRAGLSRRSVPDSALLEYDEKFVRAGASGWRTGSVTWTADASFTDRTYSPGNAEDDHRRWWSDLRMDWYLGVLWRLEGAAEWQYWDYKPDSTINDDFVNWRLGAAAHIRPLPSWEFGGEIETRFERTTSDSETGTDYDQWEAGPRISWTPAPPVWLELSPRVGRRDYGAAATYYDSYDFWEVSAQGDVFLSRGPTASVMVSYLSEGHDDPARDLDQLYLSLVVRFPIRP